MNLGVFRYFGGNMNQYKQPIMTIFLIFATAYVLTLIGCAPSGGSGNGQAAPQGQQPGGPVVSGGDQHEVELIEIDPREMRECTTDEFDRLVSWSNALEPAKEAIRASAGKKKDSTVQLAIEAIKKCDQVQAYHSVKPCKKMKRTIVNPDQAVLVNAYDAARIHKRCEMVDGYLSKFDLRPSKDGDVVVTPVPNEPSNPSVPAEPIPPQTGSDIDVHNLRECSADEFTALKSFRMSLDLANKNIDKLGGQSSWKYDAIAIDAAKTATNACESAIRHHQAEPCQRQVKNDATGKMETKVYSGETLRKQCLKARTYNYEFMQQLSSLIVPNAKLYFDTSIIANKTIAPGYSSDLTIGQCIISNLSNNSVTYGSQKALVTEARIYPSQDNEGYQMFVMVTGEGVKLECYGLGYTSLKSSKTEVVRLLKQKDTPINLSYELN